MKKFLNKILLGMDPYISEGVPTIYWELALEMTESIYGEEGVKLLKEMHQTFDASVDTKMTIILHTLQKSENGTTLRPEHLIKQFKVLAKTQKAREVVEA